MAALQPRCRPLWRWRQEDHVDLHTAVSVSMLSVSRGRASAVFKELRQRDPATTLEAVLDAMAIPGADVVAMCGDARAAADRALTLG